MMAGGWEFLEDAAGVWRWRTSDPAASRRESCKTFKSGADCVANALRNGYLAGTPLARVGQGAAAPATETGA